MVWEGKQMKVSSDNKRKQQYWVEKDGKVLFKSNSGSKAIQWAIDHIS